MFTELLHNSLNALTFFKQFFISPRTTGSLIPSSPFLCDTMLESVDWQECKHFVELGAGTGVLTKKILSKMASDASLTIFEIRPEFIKTLQEIKDSRLHLCNDSAEKLKGHYDVVFSGLPLVMLPSKVVLCILRQSQRALHSNKGQFIQFHYSRLAEKYLIRYFYFKRKYVVKNIPPAYVYRCSVR